MNTLRQALSFWKKTLQIAWKRSHPTLKRLPFYGVGMLIAYFWRTETQGLLLSSLLAILVVWAITMLIHIFLVPGDLYTLSTTQRNLKQIVLRLKTLYDSGNELLTLPGDATDEVAAEHLMRIEQWRADARAEVSNYALSESILFDTIATGHLRQALRHDRPKSKRDEHLAAVILEMEKLRLIASRASQEVEEVEKNIHSNRIERSGKEAKV